MTKQEEHFKEIKDLIETEQLVSGFDSESYKRKQKFIQDEILRCTEINSYQSQIMVQAEMAMKDKAREWKKNKELAEEKRRENAKASMVHLIERHA